jgi:hypothetical protein
VSDALVARGFRRSGRTHIRSIDPAFSEIVDTGPLSGTYGDIAPWVGLQHLPTERLKAQLMALPFDAYMGTVGGNAGVVLGGRYRTWPSDEDPRIPLQAIDLALERVRDFAKLEALMAALTLPGLPRPTVFNIVPILMQLGDRPGVEEALAAGKSLECRRPGPVCDQFQRFEPNVHLILDGAGEPTDN